MFTGLVETVGEVVEVKPTSAGFRLGLTTALSGELTPGDSLAVNGVCLTVVAADADGVHMDRKRCACRRWVRSSAAPR
jgi:riboflavin synthase